MCKWQSGNTRTNNGNAFNGRRRVVGRRDAAWRRQTCSVLWQEKQHTNYTKRRWKLPWYCHLLMVWMQSLYNSNSNKDAVLLRVESVLMSKMSMTSLEGVLAHCQQGSFWVHFTHPRHRHVAAENDEIENGAHCWCVDVWLIAITVRTILIQQKWYPSKETKKSVW